MNKIKILALFGESGVGKDYILNWIIYNIKNTHKIISCTTRPKRNNEEDGKDYIFVSEQEFFKLILQDSFIEYTEFNNWYYGTLKKNLSKDKINIGVFNISGIEALLLDRDLDVLPVRIQAPDQTRLLRCLTREKDPDCEEICRRFLSDQKSFIFVPHLFDYEIFFNDSNKDNFYGLFNRPKVKKFTEGLI